MEAIKQQSGVEMLTSRQKTQMSRSRIILVSVMVLTAFYIVWGIVRVLS